MNSMILLKICVSIMLLSMHMDTDDSIRMVLSINFLIVFVSAHMSMLLKVLSLKMMSSGMLWRYILSTFSITML